MDISKQTWVLTGAGGVVATCLRAGLASRVAVLRLVDMKPLECHHEAEESFVVDIREQQALDQVMQGAHGVLHLAGLADEADFHDLVDVNITGTYHVLEAARRAGVSRFIYASSNRLTGFYSVEDTVRIDMPPRPDGLYGVSKVAGEALGRLYADKFGLEVAAVRIGSFEDAPLDQRQLSTWLSPADCLRAFSAAMITPKLTFVAFYAVSRNTRCWWDLGDGLAIGFDPQDNAEDYASSISVDPSPASGYRPQGGLYATPAYTLDHQRSPTNQ